MEVDYMATHLSLKYICQYIYISQYINKLNIYIYISIHICLRMLFYDLEFNYFNKNVWDGKRWSQNKQIISKSSSLKNGEKVGVREEILERKHSEFFIFEKRREKKKTGKRLSRFIAATPLLLFVIIFWLGRRSNRTVFYLGKAVPSSVLNFK